MSIYLIKKELAEFLNKANMKHNIETTTIRPVAEIIYKNKKKKFLDFDNYSEDFLKKLVEDKKRIVYVDLEFWNYNYCTKDNINREESLNFLENVDIVVESVSSFGEGTITILIVLHEILLNVYKIQKLKVFDSYINNLNISKKIMQKFLVNMSYNLPLTKNYLELMKKVFDGESIFSFVFNESNNFTLNEFKAIVTNFTIQDIHYSSYFITEKIKNSRQCLKYICAVIELYQGVIDMESIVYYNSEFHLGYYLLTLEITNNNEKCYYTVIRKYMDKNGSIDMRVDKNPQLNEKLRMRKNQIEDYFDKS